MAIEVVVAVVDSGIASVVREDKAQAETEVVVVLVVRIGDDSAIEVDFAAVEEVLVGVVAVGTSQIEVAVVHLVVEAVVVFAVVGGLLSNHTDMRGYFWLKGRKIALSHSMQSWGNLYMVKSGLAWKTTVVKKLSIAFGIRSVQNLLLVLLMGWTRFT